MTLQSANILIVEDEPDAQSVVADILDLYRIPSTVAPDAEVALNYLSQAAFDAVICDLHLPGMDGIELIQTIRANSFLRDLPAIAITAYHTSAVKQQALNAGFDAYFPKPLDDTAFVRELERICFPS